MQDLKLIALDEEDLAVVSAHLQDAVVRVGDMAYLPAEKRFVAVANRFDWEGAIAAGTTRTPFARRRSGLRFERVLGAAVSGIDLNAKDAVLSLLALEFAAADTPAGYVTVRFSGGGAIRLHVECIEAQLTDLGAAWATKRKPDHGAAEPDSKG